jgi:hypothetical protein
MVEMLAGAKAGCALGVRCAALWTASMRNWIY